MPRFYLHIFNGLELIEDPEGSLFPTTDAARKGAIETALDLWSEALRARRDPRNHVVEIWDESRAILGAVTFMEALDTLREEAEGRPAERLG